MNKMPQQPGYYWAKWKIASDGTFEGDELTPSSEWEIVQVNTNILGWKDETDEANPERLSVSVSGVREVQWRDGFVWGAFVASLNTPAPLMISVGGKFELGDRVRKTKGSSWHGLIVGFYSTELTPIGYAVESEREPGSVQIYPESALAKLEDQR